MQWWGLHIQTNKGGGGGGGGGDGRPQVGTGPKWKYFLNLSQKIDIDFHFQNAEF